MSRWIHTHTIVVDGKRREVMAFTEDEEVIHDLTSLRTDCSLFTREEWKACDPAYVTYHPADAESAPCWRDAGFCVGGLGRRVDLPCEAVES